MIDHVLWFEMERSDVIRLRLAGGERRSILALRSECPESDSERVCEVGADAEIAGEQLDPGVYYVVVRSPAGSLLPKVLLDIGSRCEVDEDCAGGFLCDGGQCRRPCDAEHPCEGDTVCDEGAGGNSGHCIEVDPCESDDSCVGFRACEPHVEQSCFTAECQANEDCASGHCVDRRCADALPRLCDGDNPCPDPLVCDEDGGCVQDGACDDNADCPPGAPVCHVGSGECVDVSPGERRGGDPDPLRVRHRQLRGGARGRPPSGLPGQPHLPRSGEPEPRSSVDLLSGGLRRRSS